MCALHTRRLHFVFLTAFFFFEFCLFDFVPPNENLCAASGECRPSTTTTTTITTTAATPQAAATTTTTSHLKQRHFEVRRLRLLKNICRSGHPNWQLVKRPGSSVTSCRRRCRRRCSLPIASSPAACYQFTSPKQSPQPKSIQSRCLRLSQLPK